MHEIISLPLMAAMGGSGRELVYLGPIIQAIQEFTLDAMKSEKTAYSMDSWFNRNYLKEAKMKQIYLAKDDLSESVTEKDLQRYLDEDIHLCSDAEADEMFLKGRYHTLVSYTVAPSCRKTRRPIATRCCSTQRSTCCITSTSTKSRKRPEAGLSPTISNAWQETDEKRSQ